MSNVTNSNPLVNSFLPFLLHNIPDESSLFNLDFELYFPENLNNKTRLEHTYQWFKDLFVKSGTQQIHFKWLLFSNFLIQLSQQFIKLQSLRIDHRERTLNWPTDTMLPILHKQGFIQIRKGFFDSANETQQFNRLTRVYPTEKLIKEVYPMMFGMQIAMKHYPFIYKNAINVNNKRIWEIDPKKSANPPYFIKKSKRLLEDLSLFNKGQLIFITDVMPSMLYRVFNGGWKKNGRIYVFDNQFFGRRFIKHEERTSKTITDIEPLRSSYQFLSKQDRQKIMVGGEENAELDFVGMHPRMLYAKVGIQYDNDPYLVIVEDPNLRKFAKKVIYCALYSTNPKTMLNAIQYQINMSHSTIKARLRKQNLDTASKILDKMSKVHAPISSFFGTDISLDLCFIESEIILDVAKVLMEYDLNFMLIHDSICVPKDNKTFVKDLMLEMYKKHTGFNAQVKMEN